jgi:PPE-SVP subfamily C-terminal region
VERVEKQSGTTPPAVKSFRDFSSVRVACTGLGTSPSLGSLSVPPAWPTATPKPEYTPAVAGKPPGLTYQDGLMGVMTGRHAASHAEESLAEEV